MSSPAAIISLLDNLNREVVESAYQKALELELDPNKGLTPLPKTLELILESAETIRSIFSTQRMSIIPQTVVMNLERDLRMIADQLASLISGVDEVVNLSASVDSLRVQLWQGGMALSLPGSQFFKEKADEYAARTNEIQKLYQELKRALKQRDTLEVLLEEVKVLKSDLGVSINSSNQSTDDIKKLLEKSTADRNAIQAHVETVKQSELQVNQHVANIRQSDIDATAQYQRVQKFAEEVTSLRTQHSELIDKSTSTVQALKSEVEKTMQTWETSSNELIDSLTSSSKSTIEGFRKSSEALIDTTTTETTSLTKRLADLENQITEALQKATGVSLFSSFNERKKALVRSKTWWALGLLGLVGCSILLTLYIITHISSNDGLNLAFYTKLSLALPLIFAITFCSIQYTRERRLEEEYAFKSNISLSLVPYKEMVEKVIKHDNDAEREKYTIFLIESMNKVFTAPVFDHDGKPASLLDIQGAMKGLADSVKPLEPLIKIFNKS